MADWLLSLPPRPCQAEALSRSYDGTTHRDGIDAPDNPRAVPGHNQKRPAKGWGHLLEMRLGKSGTLLNEFALLRRDWDVKWCIMIAPNAFKEDWPLEAQKFGAPFDAIAFDSSNRKAVIKWIKAHEKTGGLISVNYEALGSAENKKILGPLISGCLLAADESINLKTRTTAYSKQALEWAKDAAFKRILSGKPTTQGPHDLWTQLRFIGELNGVDPTVFKNTYCKTGGFQGKQTIGIKNEDQLHAILERCSFNGRKTDWLKTPGKDYYKRHIDLLPDQMRLYEQMQDEFMVELANGTIVAADQIITKLIKMQQISSGFIIDEDKITHDIVPPDRNPKVLEVRRMLEEEIENKVILCCFSTRTMDILAKTLDDFGVCCIRSEQWHKKNERSRIDEKARFNHTDARVIIGQEQALRYGHTLLGSKEAGPCYSTLFVENSYSLNDRSQCEERNQGEGQLQPIAIGDFVTTAQDIKVIESLQRKEDIAAVVMQYARELGILPN